MSKVSALNDLPPRSTVPCGTCSACCRGGEVIALFPEKGDDPSLYPEDALELVRLPRLSGRAIDREHKPSVDYRLAFKRKPDGVCIFLKHGRCSIWATAPAVCRVFDCRDFFRKLGREARQAGLRTGQLRRDVLDAGRKRLHSLDEETRNEQGAMRNDGGGLPCQEQGTSNGVADHPRT